MNLRTPAVGALLALAACTSQGGATPDPDGPAQEYQVTFQGSEGEVRVGTVEVAVTDEQRATGLMWREHLPRDAGMLFVYEEPWQGTFWMQNTLIPLSIAFWGTDGRVHTILDMEPCLASPCPTYAADEPYMYALEMNAGWFEENGIGAGDRVDVRPLYF